MTPEDVAATLVQRTGGLEVAFLVERGTLHWAACAPDPVRPWGAVSDLVQGIRDTSDRADFVLRQRLYTTGPRLPVWGQLVRAAARRWTADVETGVPCRVGESVRHDGHARAARARLVGMASTGGDDGRVAAESVAAGAQVSQLRRRSDRPVGAALVGPDGRVLLACRNEGGRNRVHHAELALCQTWWCMHRTPFPAGSMLFVTLQPCRMCAEMLQRLATGPLAVRFRDVDPGRFARSTVLERRGWLMQDAAWRAGSGS